MTTILVDVIIAMAALLIGIVLGVSLTKPRLY